MIRYFNKIGSASQAVYLPGATFGLRQIKDFEFVWINQGDVAWHYDGIDYACPRGTLLLVQPGMKDSFTWDPVKRTLHSFVHFSLASGFAQSFPQHNDASRWPKLLTLPDANIVFPLFDHLRFLQSQLQPDESLIQHCLLQILLSFITGQCGTADETISNTHLAIQKVFSYVEELWTENSAPSPSIPNLVKASGVSEVHLGRIFHDAFGISPGKAFRMLRMERAAKYLIRTDLRVQEIADILCCETPYQFSRSFKSIFGKSPRVYRDYYRRHPFETILPGNLPWSGNKL